MASRLSSIRCRGRAMATRYRGDGRTVGRNGDATSAFRPPPHLPCSACDACVETPHELTNLIPYGVQTAIVVGGKQTDIVREQQRVGHFSKRADGYIEKTPKLGAAPLGGTFSDVRGNRERGSAHVTRTPRPIPLPSFRHSVAFTARITSPLGTFGTKYVDLGGITSPASATAMTCSTLVGLSSTAAAAPRLRTASNAAWGSA